MTKNDNAKFAELIAVLAETYKPFSDAKQKIWSVVFKNHQIEHFENAIYKHITDENRGTFEPKPADLLKLMPEPKQPLMLDDKGGLTWCGNTQNLLDMYPAGESDKILGQLERNFEEQFGGKA